MKKEELSLLQQEIIIALKQVQNRNLITEANLIKKIRENTKFQGKNKASLSLKDIEKAIEFLEEENLYFSIHCNSANDLFFKPEENHKDFEQDHRQRRLKSEHTLSLLISADFQKQKETKNCPKSPKNKYVKRTQRTSLNIYQNYEEE